MLSLRFSCINSLYTSLPTVLSSNDTPSGPDDARIRSGGANNTRLNGLAIRLRRLTFCATASP